MTFVNIPMKDGLFCDAYTSQPKGEIKEPLKPVLFIADAFGLRDWIYKMVDRIAEQGYFVVAPNFYFRQGKDLIQGLENIGNKEKIGDVICQMRGFMGKIDREQLVGDMNEVFQYIDQQSQVRKTTLGGIGITGYCFGGGLAVRIAAAYPDIVKIAASFHAGRLALPDDPSSPHLLLGKVKAQLYFGHADNDQSMPFEQILVLDKALDESNCKDFTSELYTGCAHGWTMKDTFMWNEEGSEKHYKSLFNLLNKY